MKDLGRLFWLCIGLTVGSATTAYVMNTPREALAGTDRHEDYILTTGSVTPSARRGTKFNILADGIWLLDYRAGKLLATIVDPNFGKTIPWAHVDLVQEFNIAPKQNVHFIMTTGATINGQTPLYLTETVTGRFAIYSMSPRPDGRPGVFVRKHDAAVYRPQTANPDPACGLCAYERQNLTSWDFSNAGRIW